MAKKGPTQPPSAGLTVRPVRVEVELDGPGVKAVAKVVDAIHGWIDDFDDGRHRLAELMLTEVFDEDAAAMLGADRGANPRWRELLRRVDAETRLSAKSLSVLARVGAYDHLVTGRYWKRLQPHLKERLLPLADPREPGGRETLTRLNEAAKHCIAFDLDRETASRFVQEQLQEAGRRRRRNAGRRTYQTQVERTLGLFGDATGVERFLAVSEGLEEGERKDLSTKLERAAKQMLAAAKGLRRR